MSIATSNPVNNYANQIAAANPEQALQIAISECERQQALAVQQRTEYQALSEIEFDSEGRIAKANMAGLWRLAGIFAKSKIVPEHYQGSHEDCFIACQVAFRCRVDPLAYMQSSYIVHGKPGIESKLAVAMLNSSGLLAGRIKYTFERDGKGAPIKCTASCTEKETGDVLDCSVDAAMVKAEKWDSKPGSKWLTMPEVMYRYRSAIMLIRAYFPEVLMGMRTVDELEDIGPNGPEIIPPSTKPTLESLTARLEGPANGANESNGEAASEADDEPLPPTHKDGEVIESDNSGDPLAEYLPRFDALDTIGAANDLEKELSERFANDEAMVARIKLLSDTARDAIRSKRGERSQQTLT